MKESFKKLGRDWGRCTLIAMRWIISHMPYPVYKVFLSTFIFMGKPIIWSKRKLAMKNLKKAFKGEKSDEEIRDIAQKCFENFGRGMVDLIYFADKPKELDANVKIVGRENLDNVLKEGKGAILIGAHFGDFILMYIKMVQEGYKTNVIMRRTRDVLFEQYISDFRNERGIKTIYDLPTRNCVVQCLKALRNNELLFILIDQNYGSDGRVFVDFFGIPAATATGPVVFSKRTGAPILPIFMIGGKDNQHRLVIDPPIPLEEAASEEEMTLKNIQKLTGIIEKYIRLYPYEWGGWMHNRWKSRTAQEQAIIDKL